MATQAKRRQVKSWICHDCGSRHSAKHDAEHRWNAKHGEGASTCSAERASSVRFQTMGANLALARDGYALVKCKLAVFKPEA